LLRKKEVRYPVQVNTRVDGETLRALDLISLFERRRRSELIREWIQSKILTYYRNPQFNKFLRMMKEAGRL